MLLDSFTYEFPLKGKGEMLMFSTEMGGWSLKHTNLTEVIKKQTNDIGNDKMLTFRVHHALCVCLCIKYYTVEYHSVIIMQLYFWYVLYMFSLQIFMLFMWPPAYDYFFVLLFYLHPAAFSAQTPQTSLSIVGHIFPLPKAHSKRRPLQ